MESARSDVGPATAREAGRTQVPPTRRRRGRPAPVTPPATWEEALAPLLELEPSPGRGERGSLALELTLTSAAERGLYQRHRSGFDREIELSARVLRRFGSRWSPDDVAWSVLPAMLRREAFRPGQVQVLQELYALQQLWVEPQAHWYGDVETIDLAGFESRRLWTLLDEAVAVGLGRLSVLEELEPGPWYDEAELTLDVTRDTATDGLRITPVLQVEGADADVVPVRFVGADGHGVVYVPSSDVAAGGGREYWRPRLARLARPVPPALQLMALERRSPVVPPAELERFRDHTSLRLQHRTTVVSSDRSLDPPTICGPTLMLRAAYSGGHELNLSWRWAYDVDGTRIHSTPGVRAASEGHRDPAGEQALLEDIDLPPGVLADLGLSAWSPPPETDWTLSGLDTMRFTTQTLPLLRVTSGIVVEVSGEPADYRESGDSLEIGLSTDAVAGSTDWFDLGVTVRVEGREVPFTTVFRALASGGTYLLLDDGAFFSLLTPELQRLRRLIEEARALQDAPEAPLRVSRFQAGLWDELTEVGIVYRQAAMWREHVAGLLSLDSTTSIEPPPTFRGELRPYQRDGFAWLAFLQRARLGGVLADDMGLGKTVQALALICHARAADPTGPPFLIVAPTSVVPTWVSEAAGFAPHLQVLTLTDTLSRRARDLGELAGGADVVVTSYTLFRLDIETHVQAAWSGLLLDEAQYVKNHRSKVHECARRLPAPFKMAITGTPVENNLMELWALLAITAPGLFPSARRFREHYAQPIEKNGDGERLAALRRRIKPLMKRRTKEVVAADLPAKQEQVLEVDLHPEHRVLYDRHLQRERQKILGLIDDWEGNRFLILRSLTLLRRLALHAAFVGEQYDDVPSSKIDALLDRLGDVVAGGHRALVFSQFTGYLGRVRARFDAAGIDYCYLDGATRDRASVIEAFKEGTAPVFLISLKAGGSGLNLPEAEYCFLLDPWWNPATEAQAVDRAHRIGQTRTVMVYRLVAKNTIEEKVMGLKARKAELAAGVLGEGEAFASTIDADDILELLR